MKLLENVSWAFMFGIVLMASLAFTAHGAMMDSAWAMTFLRTVHVFFGIVWIGLLYYFNLVQIPTMPSVPAELKPGVTKYIAPAALFYFRWAALGTVLVGIGLSGANFVPSMTFQPGFWLIGMGMWLGLIMAANVWFVIWPNQKRALGLVEADAATKAASARTAMLFSRTNFVLSLPMLYAMTMYQSMPY